MSKSGGRLEGSDEVEFLSRCQALQPISEVACNMKQFFEQSLGTAMKLALSLMHLPPLGEDFFVQPGINVSSKVPQQERSDHPLR